MIPRIFLLSLIALRCSKPQTPVSFTGLWQAVTTPYFGEPQAMVFTSPDTGYILGASYRGDTIYNILVSTQDGGHTWRSIHYNLHTFLADTSGGVMTSLFVSPYNSNILFSGRNILLRSIDGGLHWTIIDSMQRTGFPAYFADPLQGIGLGMGGLTLTRDSGFHWQAPVSQVPVDRVVFPSPRTGFATFGTETGGFAGGLFADGQMLRTADGGASWQPVTYPDIPATRSPGQSPAITGISFLDDQEGYVSTNDDWDRYSGSAILKTVDGGRSWSIVDSSLFDRYGHAQNLYMESEKEGFFSSAYGIFHTTDSCQSWQMEHGPGITLLCFPGGHTGYAVDAGGNLYKRYF